MKTTIPPVALLLLLSLSACTGGPAPITRALDEALARRSWEDLRLDAACQEEETGPRFSARLLGTGVGIWNDERQFTVPRERLLDLLAALRRAGFGALGSSSREEEEREEREREEREHEKGRREKGAVDKGELAGEEEEEEESKPEPPCRTHIRLDGVEHWSDEIPEKHQAAEVRDLARQILAVGSELGPAGVAATSLGDGLARISRGELAYETLTLRLQRHPDDSGSREGGWIVSVEDGYAELSFFTPRAGWTSPRRVRLGQQEAAALARRLAIARPAELPVNLYSSWYQDLKIRVLNHEVTFQSRRFANLTPETHGEKQQRFEQLIAALEDLKQRLE